MLKYISYDCLSKIIEYVGDIDTIYNIRFSCKTLLDFIDKGEYETNFILPINIPEFNISYIYDVVTKDHSDEKHTNKNLRVFKNFRVDCYSLNVTRIMSLTIWMASIKFNYIKNIFIRTNFFNTGIINIKINKNVLTSAKYISYKKRCDSDNIDMVYYKDNLLQLGNTNLNSNDGIIKIIDNKKYMDTFIGFILNKNIDYDFNIILKYKKTENVIVELKKNLQKRYEQSFKYFHNNYMFVNHIQYSRIIYNKSTFLYINSNNRTPKTIYEADTYEFSIGVEFNDEIGTMIRFNEYDKLSKEFDINKIYWIDDKTERYIIKPLNDTSILNTDIKKIADSFIKDLPYILKKFILMQGYLCGSSLLGAITGNDYKSDIDICIRSRINMTDIFGKINILNFEHFKIIKSNKYRYSFKYKEKSYDIFMADPKTVGSLIRDFHLSCVRAVYSYKDKEIYAFPSFYRTIKTGICYNLTSKEKTYFNSDMYQVYKKYFQRGFGYLLNKKDFVRIKNGFDKDHIKYIVIKNPKFLK